MFVECILLYHRKIRAHRDEKLSISFKFHQYQASVSKPGLLLKLLLVSNFLAQLLLRSRTRYYSAGTIIADSTEKANGIYVVSSGQASTD